VNIDVKASRRLVLLETYLICVSVLELDVDLVCTEMHERELICVAITSENAYDSIIQTNQLLVFSHSNDENLSPELHRLEDTKYELRLTEIDLVNAHINRGMHTVFHACAFQGKLQRSSSGYFDLLRLFLRRCTTLN
jgi:hypothetical protein